MNYAYVLQSLKDKTLYYGSSENPEERLNNYHNKGFEKYTSRKMPWILVYKEAFTSRADAMKREKFFKSGKGRELIKDILRDNIAR